MFRLPLLAVLTVSLLVLAADDRGLPPGAKDTQNPRDVPPTPAQAVKLIRVPDGFQVTLFAGEPEVCQPIALAFDDRGRPWVAECFSYPQWVQPGKEGFDRILIFDDADGDGRHDQRKVFAEKLPNLTGLEIGHGGVWALCAPNLLFIPRKDGSDEPAGPPQVVLDGFTLKAGHNIVNGLTWGPDGWLWGRHGITAESLVGKPGDPDDKRTRLNCSIWRYHPVRKTFEVVCHGTTNPWGFDFDDHGEAFFTNCVIGHLWHAVPGARYQRMYGQDYNRHAYELIPQAADHLHWGGGDWTSSRGGKGLHSEAGGGHAHSGGMIYLGDHFPDAYRNSIFLGNLHGNRLNRDRPERQGCGYVGKHAPDFLTSENPWFRPIAMDYGAEGAVYVTDWCDLGECHDNDGVHRSSGRIYRVSFGKTAPLQGLDLAKKTDAELVQLQLHKNDWHVRHARRLLAERAAAGKPMAEVHAALLKMFGEQKDVTRQLRALWALHVTGGAKTEWLMRQLDHPDEHVRSWAVRLLVEETPPAEVVKRLAELAGKDPSGLVRLYLASSLQRLAPTDRFEVARPLAGRGEDAADRVQPLLLWFGVEPAVAGHPSEALRLAAESKMPKVRQFIARRLTEEFDRDRAAFEAVVELLGKVNEPAAQKDLLQGVRDGLKGRRTVKMPPAWPAARQKLSGSPLAEVRESALLLALTFDDPEALATLRKTLTDAAAPADQRVQALDALVSRANPDLLATLYPLTEDKAIRGPVLRSLAAFSSDETPQVILKQYAGLSPAEKQDAITTLSSRPKYALALLDAVDKKAVARNDISAFTARQLQDLKDPKVSERLLQVWGEIRQTAQDKSKLITKYQGMLKKDVLAKADLANGRAVYNKLCFQCHMLYGEGHKIGPDLTGSNRNDLYYVLENILDPSAVIGRDYQLTNIVLKSGRLVAGIVVEETGQAVTVQTDKERIVLPRAEIDERAVSKVSMMPEGQLDPLKPEEIRDLVGYLGSKEQVPLPKGK